MANTTRYNMFSFDFSQDLYQSMFSIVIDGSTKGNFARWETEKDDRYIRLIRLTRGTEQKQHQFLSALCTPATRYLQTANSLGYLE